MRGGGSFNPRNDGPLITAWSSVIGALVIGAVGTGALLTTGGGAGGAAAGETGREKINGAVTEEVVGADGEGDAGAGAAVDAVGAVGTGTARFGVVGCAGSSVAPHMPQKRFVAGFSLPQRWQRTHPPDDSRMNPKMIAYDILQVRCSPDAKRVVPQFEICWKGHYFIKVCLSWLEGTWLARTAGWTRVPMPKMREQTADARRLTRHRRIIIGQFRRVMVCRK